MHYCCHSLFIYCCYRLRRPAKLIGGTLWLLLWGGGGEVVEEEEGPPGGDAALPLLLRKLCVLVATVARVVICTCTMELEAGGGAG